jgi:hypothetical protein
MSLVSRRLIRSGLAAFAMGLMIVTLALPAGAVLPPGAHESLAAGAPVVVIARVMGVKIAGNQQMVRCVVMAQGRGPLAQGQQFTLAESLPYQGPPRMGPIVNYHTLRPGEVWLLFMLAPSGDLAKSAPQMAGTFFLASHGWYTRRLDNLKSAAELMSKLPPKTGNQEGDADLKRLRAIYQWAGKLAFGK